MSEAGGHGELRVVVCHVGETRCALPLVDVVETMRPLPVEHIEHAPHFVTGVSIVRGEPVVVIDAARLLGVEAPPANRLALLQVDQRTVALAVTDIIGVRDVRPELLRELPPLLQDVAPDAIAMLGRLDSRLLIVLGTGHLLDGASFDEPIGAVS